MAAFGKRIFRGRRKPTGQRLLRPGNVHVLMAGQKHYREFATRTQKASVKNKRAVPTPRRLRFDGALDPTRRRDLVRRARLVPGPPRAGSMCSHACITRKLRGSRGEGGAYWGASSEHRAFRAPEEFRQFLIRIPYGAAEIRTPPSAWWSRRTRHAERHVGAIAWARLRAARGPRPRDQQRVISRSADWNGRKLFDRPSGSRVIRLGPGDYRRPGPEKGTRALASPRRRPSI